MYRIILHSADEVVEEIKSRHNLERSIAWGRQLLLDDAKRRRVQIFAGRACIWSLALADPDWQVRL